MDELNGLLNADTRRRIEHIGTADIVVGLPNGGGSDAVGHLVDAMRVTLAKQSSGTTAVIATPAADLSDAAPETTVPIDDRDVHHLPLFRPPADAFRIKARYQRGPDQGSLVRQLFVAAHLLKAKACATMDCDVATFTPERADLLIRPVLDGKFDYVIPLYTRQKHDGTITNSIIYPLTRALYGWRVRQPVGSEFGLSADLAMHCLTKAIWDTDLARFGIDIWMTTTALVDGFRVSQAFLGARPRDVRDPRPELSVILRHTVGSVFALMEINEAVWQSVTASAAIPTVGKEPQLGEQQVHVNVEPMITALRLGLKDLLPLWEQVLAGETLDGLYQVAGGVGEAVHFPDDLWIRVIYDFALGHHYRILHRDHLLSALMPIYLGRVASFVIETRDGAAADVETRIEALCQRFEAMKPYLTGQWR